MSCKALKEFANSNVLLFDSKYSSRISEVDFPSLEGNAMVNKIA